MSAFQTDFADRHDLETISIVTPDNLAAADECAVVEFFRTAEPAHGRFHTECQVYTRLAIGVQDSKIARGLVLEDARLRRYVVLESVVTIEMVRRDIQHDCNPRMEALDGFELEAADFQDDPSVPGGLIREGDGRRARCFRRRAFCALQRR